MSTLKDLIKRALPEEAVQSISHARLRSKIRRRGRMTPAEVHRAVAEYYTGIIGWRCDLDDPRTYNDKVQWMKLYGPLREYGYLADKYLVRSFVEQRIGAEHLVPLLGVWDRAEDVDFDALPERFVLKATHGCGWNILVEDKSKLDIRKTRRTLARWLELDWSFINGYELQYRFCEPRIIAEEYLDLTHEAMSAEDADAGGTGNGARADADANADATGGSACGSAMDDADADFESDTESESRFDYKLWCFNGEVAYVQFQEGRGLKLRTSFFDTDWNKQDFVCNRIITPRTDMIARRPAQLEKLVELGRKISAGVPYVRADFYLANDGRIYFGEMTFSPSSGCCLWDPPEMNQLVGEMFALPEPGAYLGLVPLEDLRPAHGPAISECSKETCDEKADRSSHRRSDTTNDMPLGHAPERGEQ